MKKSLLALSICTTALIGCATQSVNSFHTFQAKDLNPLVHSSGFKQKTQNLLVINDSSSSMSTTYTGEAISGLSSVSKLSVEKELLNRFNQTIPAINFTSGIRSFGFGPCLSWGQTKLNMAVSDYSKSSFSNGINDLTCSSGGTPMTVALDAAQADLSSTSGNIAVLILSDGRDNSYGPIAGAEALKAQYGDRLCIYSIWVGNEKDAGGQELLQQLSDVAGCGYNTKAAQVATINGMAKLVEDIFFERGPADTDMDGVLDNHDHCPNTPKGATVNSQGCWVIKGINFDTDKSDIKAQYHALLNGVAKVIKNNPGLKIEVQGHTDNQGSAAYNKALSDRRANAVKNYLAKQANAADRLSAKGYGLTQPIDTNDTAAGRANNRRVQLKIIR